MASSHSFENTQNRAPDRLGSKISPDSPLNDFLCCNCNLPVVRARQIIGCGCRVCELCFSQFSVKASETKCRRCLLPFDINQTFRDKASDNELKRRSFPCFYSDCSWEGSAFEYRDHIVICGFADMRCINPGCDQIFLRKAQKQHETVCQFRTITCQWCKKEIQINHKQHHEINTCQEYVMNCPSGCGESIKRKNVREHVDHYCKRQTRPCLFMRYGCTAKGRHDVLEQHKKDSTALHMDMLATYLSDKPLLQNGSSATEQRIKDTDKKFSQLQLELKTLRDEMTDQLHHFSQEAVKLDTMLQDMQASFQELAVLVQTLQATSYNGQFIWKIPEIKRRKEEALTGKTLSLYSAPFFTSRFGYKLCLRLYLGGDGSGKGTSISFFLTIMKGEYDALLPWPFSQMVTLMLLDQTNKKKHISQCFKPEPSSSSFWRPHSEMNIASGCPKFAPISVLNDTNYVQDDTMFFKVVIDLSGLSHP